MLKKQNNSNKAKRGSASAPFSLERILNARLKYLKFRYNYN